MQLVLQSVHGCSKALHLNLQPLDPLHRRLITIGLIAAFSGCGPVTLLAPIACLPSGAVSLSLGALVSFTMVSCSQLLSQLTNRVSPLFVTEFGPQS